MNDKEIVSAGQLNSEISKQLDIEHEHQNDSDSSEFLPGANLSKCLTSIEKSSNSSTDPICTQKFSTDTSNTVEVNEVSKMSFNQILSDFPRLSLILFLISYGE